MEKYDPWATISIKKPASNERQIIKQIPTTTGMRTLGVQLSPSGNLDAEFDHLCAKAARILVGFRSTTFTAKEWQKAYRTIAIPRLIYSLQVTHFTKRELERVQAKFMTSALQARHVHGRFPRAVVFAPESLGGLGLYHLFFEQSIAQVKLAIGLLRVQSSLSDLFKIGLGHFHLHAGLAECPFSDPHDLRYLELDWYRSVSDALYLTDTRITTVTPAYLCPKCEGDICLMEAILSLDLPTKTVKALNGC